MTAAMVLALFAGAFATVLLMVGAAVIVELAAWLTTPRNTPDEHADVTSRIELRDMEAPR